MKNKIYKFIFILLIFCNLNINIYSQENNEKNYVIIVDTSFSALDDANMREQKLAIVRKATIKVIDELPDDARIGFYPSGCFFESNTKNQLYRENGELVECFKSQTGGLIKLLKLGIETYKQSSKYNVHTDLKTKNKIINAINILPNTLRLFVVDAVGGMLENLSSQNINSNVNVIFVRLSQDNKIKITPLNLLTFSKINRDEYMAYMSEYDERDKWGNGLIGKGLYSFNIEKFIRDFYACIDDENNNNTCELYRAGGDENDIYIASFQRYTLKTEGKIIEDEEFTKSTQGKIVEDENFFTRDVQGRILDIQTIANKELKQLVPELIEE